MSKCYNCGCDIDPEDKTRLCDKCKRIILPFVKFMDASTSSAVRRLIQNERNLRNAGAVSFIRHWMIWGTAAIWSIWTPIGPGISSW